MANYFTVLYTENLFTYQNTPVPVPYDPDTNGIFSLENILFCPLAYPGIFFGGVGGSTNSVEDRENGDLGAVAS